LRIGDFGLALNVGAETTQITGVGSPAYMSPEQIREELVDHRTDLYSLGVVMYQMLCGKLPFHGSNKFSIIYQITQQEPAPPSSHRRGVPEALDRIVRRAMQKDAAARYHSGDEFADDLVRALRNASGPARRDSLGDADKFAALRVLGFFKRFSEAELWEVVRIGHWQRVAAGTEIVREGEPGDFFCVLLEGQARVTKNRKLISVLGPGECFGEMAYLSAERRERGATVTAARDAHIVRVPTAELERASVGCRAHFDRAFVSILVERLNRANMRLTSA
jgi:eukaryotic-like serine/threonine-protein kinase